MQTQNASLRVDPQGHSNNRSGNPADTTQQSRNGSLLDPRTHGWKLEQSWPGLFDLYIKDGETCARLHPELNDRVNRFQRGHTLTDTAVPILERLLFIAALFAHEKKLGNDCSSFGFESLRKQIAQDAIEVLGPSALEIISASSYEKAELGADRLAATLRRAGSGIARQKFSVPSRGTGEVVCKELLAIWTAQGLCAHLRRLPTKREVRERLEAIGIRFAATSKGINARWSALFVRAGLGNLPED
jgi:hypothetical protein